MSTESLDASTARRLRRVFALVRESLAGKQHDYTKGSIGHAVLLLAIPMMLEMAMESVFAIVDIFWVAALGAPAIAAVGLTEAVLTLLYAVAVGLSMAVTALVARRIGAHEPEAAAQVAGQTLWLGLGAAAVVAAIGVPFAPEILRLMGAEPEVITGGAGYTTLMLGGSLTIMLLFLFNAVLRGAGDAAFAMRVLWLANAINIVLGPCLIYGVGPFPTLGVSGAAVATNIGRGIGALFALYWLTNGRGRVALELRDWRPIADVLRSLLRVSAGGVLQWVIATSSYIVMVLLVSGYGSAAVAGNTIAYRIIMFTFLPAWGLSGAAATLVGQNLGAREPERAERSVWVATKYNVLFLGAIAIVLVAFSESLVRIFTAEPDVVVYATTVLRVIALGFPLYAVGMTMVQAFNGAGDTSTPTWINVLCFWLLQLPLAYALARPVGLGPMGLFIAAALAESVLAVVAWLVFRRGAWKLKIV
jgi:putative MATE family efflux protein